MTHAPTVERRGATATAADSTSPDAPASKENFLRLWRWWLAPALLSLVLALVFIDPFAGDWDALDYAVLALHGEPSSMVLGRMLFMFTNHALFRIAHALFGLQAEHAYLLFKYVVVFESPLTVAACWKLSHDLTRSARSATVAALLLALSPFYVIYSGQAMTEIPSILLLFLALIVHLRGLRERKAWLVFAGACLLGAGVNLRESVGFYGLWLAFAPFVCGWRMRARELFLTAMACALFFIFALGPFALWYLLDVRGYQGKWHVWVESTRMEAALHPVTLGNFKPLLLWFFVAAPLVAVVLPLAAFKEWKERGVTPLLLMAGVGLFANLILILYYSTPINGRYILSGLPGLVPLAADFFMRDETKRAGDTRRAFVRVVAGVVAVALLVGWVMYGRAWSRVEGHAMTKEYRARLALLPDDAVVMAGGQTVAVSFWRGVGAGRWDWIGTGGGWPGNERIVAVIEGYLKQGRRVYLDTDPRLWSTYGWQLSETRAVAQLESHFRFRRLSETIYEIRPPDDQTARDRPDLKRLLPENR